MKLSTAFFIVLLVTFISCKKESAGSICFSRTLTDLKIANHTDKEFYFAAFGQNILPLILWFPGCGSNIVAASSTINTDLSTIAGYLDNGLLVIYWWECNGNNPGEIHQVTLGKEQSECK